MKQSIRREVEGIRAANDTATPEDHELNAYIMRHASRDVRKVTLLKSNPFALVWAVPLAIPMFMLLIVVSLLSGVTERKFSISIWKSLGLD